MPKVRRVKSPSTDCNRSFPYPSTSRNIEMRKPTNLSGSVDEMKEWEEARCPICMEPPHNGVLLKCSSHEKGCRPYMCNTSYRHSNCLDQFCKSFASHLSSEVLEEIPAASRVSHGREVQPEPGHPSHLGSQLKPKLICPLCRGEIYGYMLLDPARSYMNSKPRSCSSETCEFQGTYPELRKHARSEHPSVRPSDVDPSRQCDWLRMEQERSLEDLFSSIHSSSGVEYNRNAILTGGFADLMSSFLYEIFISIEDVSRMASLITNSRHRVPLYDRRSGITHRVSNHTQANQSARWRSNLPSVHQLERIARSSRVRTNVPILSSRDLEAEANRTARWRTNLSSLRTPREEHQFYRDLSSEVTSSTRMPRTSQGTQTNHQSDISSSGRISAISSLSSERSTRLPPSFTSASSSAKQFSLQFPSRTHLLRISTPRAPTSPRPRFLLQVQAKKQSFNSFDDLLANSEKPVLVDFYATWCGPCQFMVPILNEVSTRLKDKIQVVKIDTEKYPSIADKYRIEALPTFIMFKDGEPYDRFEGALNADQLIERIEAGLKVEQ